MHFLSKQKVKGKSQITYELKVTKCSILGLTILAEQTSALCIGQSNPKRTKISPVDALIKKTSQVIRIIFGSKCGNCRS